MTSLAKKDFRVVWIINGGGMGGMGGMGGFSFDPRDLFSQFFGTSDAQQAFNQYGGDESFGGMPRGVHFSFGGSPGMGGFSGFPSGFQFSSGNPRASSRRERPEPQVQDPAIERPLAISLRDIYSGVTKKLKITKRIVSDNGSVTTSDKVVEVNIKPVGRLEQRLPLGSMVMNYLVIFQQILFLFFKKNQILNIAVMETI